MLLYRNELLAIKPFKKKKNKQKTIYLQHLIFSEMRHNYDPHPRLKSNAYWHLRRRECLCLIMRELRGASQDLRHVKPHFDGKSDWGALNRYKHWLTEKNKNADGNDLHLERWITAKDRKPVCPCCSCLLAAARLQKKKGKKKRGWERNTEERVERQCARLHKSHSYTPRNSSWHGQRVAQTYPQ